MSIEQEELITFLVGRLEAALAEERKNQARIETLERKVKKQNQIIVKERNKNVHHRETIENLKKIKMGDDTDYLMDDCVPNLLKKSASGGNQRH